MTDPGRPGAGILCAGSIVADSTKVIDRYPALDHLAVIEDVSLSTGGPSGQSPGLKPIMREKLENTQRLLEAIVKQDFTAMGRDAESLGRISETEIASWQHAARADYTKQALLFVLSAKMFARRPRRLFRSATRDTGS